MIFRSYHVFKAVKVIIKSFTKTILKLQTNIIININLISYGKGIEGKKLNPSVFTADKQLQLRNKGYDQFFCPSGWNRGKN